MLRRRPQSLSKQWSRPRQWQLCGVRARPRARRLTAGVRLREGQCKGKCTRMRGTGGAMLERRLMLIVTFGVVLLVAPCAVAPQPAARVPRVGVLSPGKPPPDDAFHQRERFEAGLRDLGWTPGAT